MARSMAPRRQAGGAGDSNGNRCMSTSTSRRAPALERRPRSSSGHGEPVLQDGKCGSGNSLSSACWSARCIAACRCRRRQGEGEKHIAARSPSNCGSTPPSQQPPTLLHVAGCAEPHAAITPQERIPAAAASRTGKPDGAGRRRRQGAGAGRMPRKKRIGWPPVSPTRTTQGE